jgi:hypothetical protein
MAMKLFAHVLRSATSGSGPEEPAPGGSLEPRLWVFRDLVVRREGYAPWGLSHAVPAGDEATTRREPTAETLWADTQPWCHE